MLEIYQKTGLGPGSPVAEKVAELADDFKTSVVGTLSRSEQVLLAEEQQQILLEAFPDSKMADEYRKLAEQIMAVCEERE